MADHVLSNIHGDEALPVVDGNGMPYKLRKDDGTTGPGAEYALLRTTVHRHDTL
jgi:hypothetical protein